MRLRTPDGGRSSKPLEFELPVSVDPVSGRLVLELESTGSGSLCADTCGAGVEPGRVTFDRGTIRVDGQRVARPQFNSENELVFDYLFTNPNRRVSVGELEHVVGRPLSKRLHEIVRQLGFTGKLRETFFPGVGNGAVVFVNPPA